MALVDVKKICCSSYNIFFPYCRLSDLLFAVGAGYVGRSLRAHHWRILAYHFHILPQVAPPVLLLR